MNSFDNQIRSGIVLVDFYADWCGPCKMLKPILEELENDRGEFKVLKINVDTEPELSRRYGIMSIPTLILFKDGIEKSTKVGLISKSEINEWIESVK